MNDPPATPEGLVNNQVGQRARPQKGVLRIARGQYGQLGPLYK
jgi:hypothetical protein